MHYTDDVEDMVTWYGGVTWHKASQS